MKIDLDNLDAEQIKSFLQEFLDFYLVAGFGRRTKSDIDAEIYHLLCKYGYIEGNDPPITQGQKLGVSAATINRYKQFRFYNNYLSQDDIRKAALHLLGNNFQGQDNKSLVFAVYDLPVELYLKNILQQHNITYNCTLNHHAFILSIDDFLTVYEAVGGSFEDACKRLKKKYKSLYDKASQGIANNKNGAITTNGAKLIFKKCLELITSDEITNIVSNIRNIYEFIKDFLGSVL